MANNDDCNKIIFDTNRSGTCGNYQLKTYGTASVSKEQQRLRGYLNKNIAGDNTDIVLRALACGSAHLIHSVEAVNEQLYITTASGQYLDSLLADRNLTRPDFIGLGDDKFRDLGIEVINRKQTRDLISEILETMFGGEAARAFQRATVYETYALEDGDDLILQFDDTEPVTVIFEEDQFNDIGAATAQEISDVILRSLRSQGKSAAAYAAEVTQLDGTDKITVTLISSTKGFGSAVKVLGGKAQTVLQFPSIRPTTMDSTTTFDFSIQPTGYMRMTWTGGTDPSLGKVIAGDRILLYPPSGNSIDDGNRGTYEITAVVGGTVNNSYIEFVNAVGVAQTGVLPAPTDTSTMIVNSERATINQKRTFASVSLYGINGVLEIFVPATTEIVNRLPAGGSYLAEGLDPVVPQDFIDTLGYNCNGVARSQDTIDAYTEKYEDMFLGGAKESPDHDAVSSVIDTTQQEGCPDDEDLTCEQNSYEYNWLGPHVFDEDVHYIVGEQETTLTAGISEPNQKTLHVVSSAPFPDEPGWLVLGFGTSKEEIIPYIGTVSADTILIGPVYEFEHIHEAGTNISYVTQNHPYIVDNDASDYPFYATDVVTARDYAEELIEIVRATGMTVNVVVLYPNDVGLGKWGDYENSERYYVYGPDPKIGETLFDRTKVNQRI